MKTTIPVNHTGVFPGTITKIKLVMDDVAQPHVIYFVIKNTHDMLKNIYYFPHLITTTFKIRQASDCV